jgi:hypothetical protein
MIGFTARLFLDYSACYSDDRRYMPVAQKKNGRDRAAAQRLAAKRAEEAAKVLHSLAETLAALNPAAPPTRQTKITPRNWWRLQAGHFADDPSFPEFVQQIQAARKREA